MRTPCQASATSAGVLEGRDRVTGEPKWMGIAVDLVVGSNAGLRALAQVNASRHVDQASVGDFDSAWNKVMNLGRYGLA